MTSFIDLANSRPWSRYVLICEGSSWDSPNLKSTWSKAPRTSLLACSMYKTPQITNKFKIDFKKLIAPTDFFARGAEAEGILKGNSAE